MNANVKEQRVVNTSPLIYLSRANMLDLLFVGCDQVVVPQAVADEIRAWPTADAAQKALAVDQRLVIVAPEPIPPSIQAWDLGAGESAVLAFGANRPGMTLVIDDLAARRCAASLNLPVRGTLGLVLKAKQIGLLPPSIPSARTALRQLHQAGMYLSPAVAAAALEQVGE